MARRSISFDEDIVDDVYQQFEGKYSKEYISLIFNYSIDYIQQLMLFSDKLAINIPGIGYFVADNHYLNIRLKKLTRKEKKGKLTEAEVYELECLKIKSKKIMSVKEISYRCTFFRKASKFVSLIKNKIDVISQMMKNEFDIKF